MNDDVGSFINSNMDNLESGTSHITTTGGIARTDPNTVKESIVLFENEEGRSRSPHKLSHSHFTTRDRDVTHKQYYRYT